MAPGARRRRARSLAGRVLVRSALLAACLLARGPSRASAEAIGPTFLSWSGCAVGEGPSTIPFDCAPEGGSVYTIVGAFAVSESISHAVSMDVDLDIVFPVVSGVPDFWNIGLGGCNASALVLVKGSP